MENKEQRRAEAHQTEYRLKLSAIAEKRRQIEQDFDSVRERVGPAGPQRQAGGCGPTPRLPRFPLPNSKAELQTGKTTTHRGPASGTAPCLNW